MIEVDESKRNLESLIVPNYKVYYAEAENINDQIRIIALVHDDLDVILRKDIMFKQSGLSYQEITQKIYSLVVYIGNGINLTLTLTPFLKNSNKQQTQNFHF